MSFREKVDKRLSRKQKAYEIESLMKNKRSEDYQVIEEVFDKSTLMVIYGFMNKGIIDEIHGVVNAGKEARVYWGKDTKGKERIAEFEIDKVFEDRLDLEHHLFPGAKFVFSVGMQHGREKPAR